jgi:hypothetical protein
MLVLALLPMPTASEAPVATASDEQAADRDFEALYRQAVAAMEDLRRAGARRPAAPNATL